MTLMQKRRIILGLAALVAGMETGRADEVLLKNGDRITGTVLSKTGSVLEMKTAYSDKIVIKWEAVETFNSENPVTLILKDKQELTGVAVTGKDGTLALKSAGVYQTQPIPLAEIKDINKKFFSGQANAGGVLSGGNTERQAYHMDAEIIVQGRDDRVTFGGQYNYADSTDNTPDGRSETTLNARNFQIYADYAHFFTDQWYGYAHGLFTNDRLQDVKLRSAFGVGVGYQFFASEDINLSLEAGPDYLNVDFYDYPFRCSNAPGSSRLCVPLDDRSDFAGRWAVKYDQWFWDHAIQAFHIHEGIVSSDFFIRTRTGFRVPLWRGFQFTNEIQVDYFSKPAPGRESVDTRYLFNLGYGF